MPSWAGRVLAQDVARSVLVHMVSCCGAVRGVMGSKDGGGEATCPGGADWCEDSRVWQQGVLQSCCPS